MKISRIQLFQLNEQPWCPKFVQETMNDLYHLFWTFQLPSELVSLIPEVEKYSTVPIYRRVVDPLARALHKVQQLNGKQVVVLDICSGTSGPIPLIAEEVNNDVDVGNRIRFYLSDPSPNLNYWKKLCTGNPNLFFLGNSTNPTNITSTFNNNQSAVFRTFNLCFHQFDNYQARTILNDCLNNSEGFMICEAGKRDIISILALLTLLPLVIWIVPPLYIRPLSITKLYFIYVIPVILIFTLFDSLVSCLRTRSNQEIPKLMDGLNVENWQFEYGTRSTFFPLIKLDYFIGVKNPNNTNL